MSEKQWAGYARHVDGPCVIIDLMECTAGVWRMDGSVAGYEAELPRGFEVEAGGKPVVCRRTEAYRKPALAWKQSAEAAARSSGIAESGRVKDLSENCTEDSSEGGSGDERDGVPEVVKRAGFSFELPAAELGTRTEIRFFLKNESGERKVLPVTSLEYQAKLTDALANAWWSFGGYMVTFLWKERTACGLVIERAGRAARMRREAKLLKEIATASYGSKQMALVRGLYWAAGPLYKKKNIWIMFDKLYKGGDCGEYFYKYVCGRQERKGTEAVIKSRDSETAEVYGRGRDAIRCGESRKAKPADIQVGQRICPVYVLRADAADFARLRREGYHPAAYRTLVQRIQYLYASVVFATHSGVPSFCGFNKWEVRFVQDRLRAVNTCIQHGLSVQDLTADSNRLVNNNKRYYCASQSEIENLSGSSYDYAPGVLRLTGIPRYDGLVDQARRQILIAPTWRSYLSMPSVMGQERPYNPEFKNSDYFRIYMDLLTDGRLRRTAERTGYQILYLLHPVYQAQKADFAEVCENGTGRADAGAFGTGKIDLDMSSAGMAGACKTDAGAVGTGKIDLGKSSAGTDGADRTDVGAAGTGKIDSGRSSAGTDGAGRTDAGAVGTGKIDFDMSSTGTAGPDKTGVVRIATPLEVSYEQALTESALMVTDFSGVQFDFAYMRKPVVYFHPPELPPHYGEGGFSYERQGFGEICTQTDELVELLCGYMEAGCRLKSFYREREDAFFAYDDRENCRRIYEDALTLQEEISGSQ